MFDDSHTEIVSLMREEPTVDKKSGMNNRTIIFIFSTNTTRTRNSKIFTTTFPYVLDQYGADEELKNLHNYP